MGSCFPAGTQITLADGSLRSIEDVQFGDTVLSHKGVSRRVIDTMRRNFTGDLITVFAKGWGKLTMTDDHVVLVVRDGNEKWVKAGEITEDDQLLVSRGISVSAATVVDLSNYIGIEKLYADADCVFSSGSSPTKRFLPLDDLTCFVIGLYVAEGSSSFDGTGHPCRAIWTLHEDEVAEADQIKLFAERLGLSATVQHKTGTKAVNVRVQSTVLTEFLKNTCGRFSNRKQVPEFILRGTPQQRLAFIRGYFAGDGHLTKFQSGRKAASGNTVVANQVSASTASKVLSQQVATLCVSLGMKPGRTLVGTRAHQRFDAHHVYLYSVDAGLLMGKEVKPGTSWKIVDSESGQCRRIREITRTPVVGYPVFDFTVEEDHSFVAEGLVVHNCQGHALSSVCEYTHLVATKQPRQFSPLFAYYASQKRDGLLGRDVGSTIAGGLAAAKDDGSCPDEIMPYRLPYTGRFAQGAYEAARGFLIKRHSVCRNYADVYNFLASGQGGVEIGIRWPDEWMNCSGVLERYSPGMSGGGHAVCFLGYSGSRKDSQGRPYLWLANSWGTRWGQGGWALVSPAAVDQMAQHPDTAMVGMSDMAVARVRDVSWIGKGSVFGEGQQPQQKPLDVLPMFEKPVRVERAAVLRAWKGSVS